MSVETYQSIRRGGEVFSSENALSLIRPVLFSRQHDSPSVLQSLLHGLHLATNGAFYEVPIGAQVAPIVQSLRTIETYAAPKKGGIFDSHKVAAARQSIANHEQPNTPIALEPDGHNGAPIELERKSGKYLVWLVFGENEAHNQSIRKITAHIGNYAINVCRRKLHEEDEIALELASGQVLPRMLVGELDTEQMPDDLQEVAADDPFSFYETASKRYSDMHEDGLLDSRAPEVLLPEKPRIMFGALDLVYSPRKQKRK
jgi:hypothetical protein